MSSVEWSAHIRLTRNLTPIGALRISSEPGPSVVRLGSRETDDAFCYNGRL
jgi:hypothetical protein